MNEQPDKWQSRKLWYSVFVFTVFSVLLYLKCLEPVHYVPLAGGVALGYLGLNVVQKGNRGQQAATGG